MRRLALVFLCLAACGLRRERSPALGDNPPCRSVEPPPCADDAPVAEIACWDRQADTLEPSDDAQRRIDLATCLENSGHVGRAVAHAKLAIVAAQRAHDEARAEAGRNKLASLLGAYASVRFDVPLADAGAAGSDATWTMQFDGRPVLREHVGRSFTVMAGRHRVVFEGFLGGVHTSRVIDVCLPRGRKEPTVVSVAAGDDGICPYPRTMREEEPCNAPPPPQGFCPPERDDDAYDTRTLLAVSRCSVFVPDRALALAKRALQRANAANDRELAKDASTLLDQFDHFYGRLRIVRNGAMTGELDVRPRHAASFTVPVTAGEARLLPGASEIQYVASTASRQSGVDVRFSTCLMPGETRTLHIPSID